MKLWKKIKNYCLNNKIELSILIFLISLSLFFASLFRVEGDYLWHIKAGEYMASHGILTKDVFSWILSGEYWMSHEWLFEMIIYYMREFLGNGHFILYPFISFFFIYFIIYKRSRENIKKNILFSLLWFTFSFIFVFYIQIRPHLISFGLFTLTLYILYDLFQNKDSKKIYLLPFITIFWANFHGGSSNLGYLLCFCFLIAGLFKFQFEKIEAKRLNIKQMIKYLIVGIICIPCTCINIHGVKMLYYPYTNMMDVTMLKNITEWQPTLVSDISHYPFFILAIFVLFVLLLSKKKIQFIDFFLFGIAIFLGLKSIRFWPYLYIISSFYIFSYVKEFKTEIAYKSFLAFSLTYLLMFSMNVYQKAPVEISKRFMSEEMIQKIKEENPKKLYNFYDYGGELIYNDIPVFMDGRADLYSEHKIFDDYLVMNKMEYNAENLIEKYDFDYFIVRNTDYIRLYLASSKDYELVYQDLKNGSSLYKKR